MALTQLWIGSTDVGFMLTEIGGWHVGCVSHCEATEAVDYARNCGYVTIRMHYAPAIPEGVEAFEVTDAGIAELRRLRGDKAAEDALMVRGWYRERLNAERTRRQCD